MNPYVDPVSWEKPHALGWFGVREWDHPNFVLYSTWHREFGLSGNLTSAELKARVKQKLSKQRLQKNTKVLARKARYHNWEVEFNISGHIVLHSSIMYGFPVPRIPNSQSCGATAQQGRNNPTATGRQQRPEASRDEWWQTGEWRCYIPGADVISPAQPSTTGFARFAVRRRRTAKGRIRTA